MGEIGVLRWLAFAEHELLLFAAVFLLIGALDELAMDLAWLWLRLTGRARTRQLARDDWTGRPLLGPAAVLIPAWAEEAVIAPMLAHARRAWPQADLRFYVGCYRNDPATLAAIGRGAGDDPRVRAVIHGRAGPTTKADCLNRLYAALCADEVRHGRPFRLVVLHDAEDMVDPAALPLLDRSIGRKDEQGDFVQLPVLPVAQARSRWIGSHYCEEFAEAHGKAMVVREALGAALPSAGTGCGFARAMLGRIAEMSPGGAPFAVEALTEDYELGLRIEAAGGRSRFLRARGDDGRLIATRACFPGRIDQAVRQKARWIHGIALQGWDRTGWSGRAAERWMRLRDRRGPLAALVLFAAYLLLLLGLPLAALEDAGLVRRWPAEPLLDVLISLCLASFAWRLAVRCAFTAREYGAVEGLRAIVRLPVSNTIAIMAGRRALWAYVRCLGGAPAVWDKTAHELHPALRPAETRA